MADEKPKKKLPVASGAPKGKAAKTKAGGWAAFTDGGSAPTWVIAARVVMVIAFAATIPTILNFEHGNRLIWTIAIASLPFFWMAFGYHLWRRICPLAVMGQLGRLLGKPGTRKMGDWMGKNYLLVQLGLMVVALSLRLSGTNGSALWLASFLGVVALAAIVTSFVYGGKTWCNFLCPVGMVEKIHTEPAKAATGGELTSQCAPCVACKKHCPDIDLEQGYWKEATERPRRIAYFAWPGIVVAFYTFYFLTHPAGWDYYWSGRWAYDGAHALDSFDLIPALPVAVAAPLTLIAFGLASFLVFHVIESVIHGRLLARDIAAKKPAELSEEDRAALQARVRHGMLAFCGLVAFNAFYIFAGQPSLRTLPDWVADGWTLLVVFASTAMFGRRFARREDKYVHEKFAQKILKKWEWGDAPPSDDLKDIYLLHTERTKQRESRLRAYKETIREMVADGTVTRGELVILDSLRAQLGISDKEHQKIIGELSSEERQLFDPAYQGSVESRLASEQYRKDLERIVVEAARAGTSPSAGTLDALRTERGVSDEDEAQHLQQILAPGGPIAALYDAELAAIGRLVAAAEATADPSTAALAMPASGSLAGIRTPQLSTKVLPTAASVAQAGSDSASINLLRHLARRRAREHAVMALGVLAVMTKRPEVEHVRAQAAARGQIRPQLLDMLSGVDPALRVPLVESLARLDRAEAAPLTAAPILAIANDGSRHLRAACAVLLSRFDDEASRSQLAAMIDDPEPIVREAAVRAMGAKSRLTRDLLTKVLNDPEAIVRHAAVRAVSGGTTGAELPAVDPAVLAQTTRGVGKQGVYATLDANAAMASLTTIEKMMLIRQVPIFAELAADDLEELATVVEERRIDPGKDVFREGDPGDAVYLIVKGTVCVFIGGDGTRPERVLSELGPGACIGEMAVLDASPRSATVRALEKTRTLRVPGEGFKRVMSERPEMSQAIVAELVKRMRGMMAQGPAPSLSNPAIPISKPDE